jgi:hypothetical protein
LDTVCYLAIASAWMDVLPWLLPQKESKVELAIFSVSVESNNGLNLYGGFWNLPCQDSSP